MNTSLFDSYQELKRGQTTLHARDAAKELGVSEAEIVASLPWAVRIGASFHALVRSFGALDEVKLMTRNDFAVIERWGRFREIEAEDGAALGQVVGEDIDLRLFFHHWRSALLVEENVRDTARVSLQIFDRQGDSVTKIFAESDATKGKLRALPAAFPLGELLPLAEPAAAAPSLANTILDERSLAQFFAAWDGMQNTHEFYGLLRRFELARVRALELAGPSRALEVQSSAVEAVLQRASTDTQPIMVFVGSRGVLQIHTGNVKHVKRMGGYLNVLDPEFNLHLRDDRIHRAFVVRKPTADGIVTSLELYDERGETIAILFSKRKPGQVEGPYWRELLASLPRREAV